MEFLKELNPQQKKAVLDIENDILLLASVGSGKTRTLVYKIAYLLTKGISPQNIMALTFTNKAAEEMKNRVYNLLGIEPKQLWIGTFHSICTKLLRMHYKKDFSIFDEEDQIKIIRETIKSLNSDISPYATLERISFFKQNMIFPDFIEAKDKQSLIIKEIYKIYQEKLIQYNGFDFDDIIIQTINLFKSNKNLLFFYQKKFKYILVDEYQDTNLLQFEFLKLFRQKSKFFVVGDDDQAIYSWRGANPYNIKKFTEEFKDVKIYTLTINYRSTKAILEIANNLIFHNKDRICQKILISNKPKGCVPVLFIARDIYHEAEFVAQTIQKELKEGRNLSDFAVLYRSHWQSLAIEEALAKRNIRYFVVGAVSFFKRKEIKDILAYLTLLENQWDWIAFERAINTPKRGIGEATLKKIKEISKSFNLSPLEAIQKLLPQLSSKTKHKILDFYNLIKGLNSIKEKTLVFELIQEIIKKINYLDYLNQQKDYQIRKENLMNFIAFSKSQENLKNFLSQMSLYTNLDDMKEDKKTDAVVLMTLHCAKGLEFEIVFIIGLCEGLLPHFNADLNEERRLCYVGITRAKERIYLSYWRFKDKAFLTKESAPSRFLIESKMLGERVCLDNVKVGKKVIHTSFGEGIIESVDSEYIDVRFSGGLKKLSLRYATLYYLE